MTEATTQASTTPCINYDAVVIGTGLAGLTATLQLLERGGRVVLLEKESKLGGNSIKASSGINSCVPTTVKTTTTSSGDQQNKLVVVSQDEIDAFVQDTTQSAGDRANSQLIQTLVEKSADSLQWLVDRLQMNDLLQHRSRLGGHTRDRTHRPANGTIGFALVSGMQRCLKNYQEAGMLTVMTRSKVVKLLQEEDKEANGEESPRSVIGVKVVQESDDGTDPVTKDLLTNNVVLATGGFAAARDKDSYLAKYAPQYLEIPATVGDFSTGDGILLASMVGAGNVDMDQIQIHPTGFVDPCNPTNRSKILCAEVMRGVGGILLNRQGKRFCNELGTRNYVTGKMQDQIHESSDNSFYLLLSSSAANQARPHVDFYLWKGLLKKLEGIVRVEEYMNIESGTLRATLLEYQSNARTGHDDFGKETFPDTFSEEWDKDEFYVGKVTHVLHYCMGGLTINTSGQVLNKDTQVIPGLYAAGEVAGGVHGRNRLAGNSLLECLVYGRIIGQHIVLQSCKS